MGIPTGWELILLLGVLVLLFGATKLPTAARSIGQSLRIFKAETKGLRSDDTDTAARDAQPGDPNRTAAPQPLPPSSTQVPPRSEETPRNTDTTR